MEYLDQLLSQSSFPILSAFLLGIMTVISPCPLATNITATAYISKDLSDKKKIFLNGLVYTLGRAISYTALGVILFFGASKFNISSFFNTYGERLLGPLLLIIGIFMLDLISIKFPGVGSLTDKLNGEKIKGKYSKPFRPEAIFYYDKKQTNHQTKNQHACYYSVVPTKKDKCQEYNSKNS